ncbi:hypothetical protein D0Z00_002159 [Geotrichum galactomycetum]|uniref:Uncharacterized protein n=1 Tax=Geotrichum galactomycetum TaxID=27317 RepID=A0ACB6V4W8_9ASCO|nr:hypothetical protein D0Z00_002159 [Geotrichum candidum]
MSANNIIEEEEASAIVANHIVAHAEYLDDEDQMSFFPHGAAVPNKNPAPGHPENDTSNSSSSSSSSSEDNDDSENTNPLKLEYQALSWRERPSHITMRVAMVVQIIGIMSAVTSQLDIIVYLICQSHYNQSEPLAPLPSDAFSLAAGNNTVDGRQSFQDPRCFSADGLALAIVIFCLNESRSEKERAKSQGEHLTRRNSFLDERRRRRFSAHSASFANLDDASTAVETFEPELTFTWSLEYFIEKAREIVHNADILGPLRALNFTHLQDRRARINAYILVFVQATLSEVIVALMPLVFLYAKTQFGWTSVENGYFISLIGGARFAVLSTLLPFVINFCRKRWEHVPNGVDVLDKRLLQGGLLFSIAGHLLMAESPTGTFFMAAVCVIAFGSGSSPLLRNAVIKHSPQDRIGEVLGAASLISRLQNTFIPAMFATVYSLTVKYRPQAIIELVCALEGLMFVLISGLYLQGSVTLDGIDELVNQQA